jgi:hypothetical protein
VPAPDRMQPLATAMASGFWSWKPAPDPVDRGRQHPVLEGRAIAQAAGLRASTRTYYQGQQVVAPRRKDRGCSATILPS